MEGVSPTLQFLMVVKRCLERGESIRVGLQYYWKNHQNEISLQTQRWFMAYEQGGDWQKVISEIKSPQRRGLLMLLTKGISGQAIYTQLIQLEDEIVQITQEELDQHIAKLPFKVLLPLMLLQFPAFLVLLFGPILAEFLTSMRGM